MTLRSACLLAVLAGFAAPASAASDYLNQGRQLLGSQAPAASTSSSSLSDTQIAGGLKEALKVGAERTVKRLGNPGGYLDDTSVHIPLPGTLAKLKGPLTMAGAGNVLADLETRMNRAAEAAAPKALDILADAVSKMSLSDAKGILNGPQDAATQYFKRTSSDGIAKVFKPIIDQTLSDVGAVKALQTLSYRAAPLGGLAGFDLTEYATGKAMEGLFHYIGSEEASIRANPAARSTDLLKQVFAK
ncbi:MAG: DUF4197 domain-containing protein [Alphaproteobacteria bacterium]|nr:DUF4197 domain-containing protein [Alphaproteobacteria bacterium]